MGEVLEIDLGETKMIEAGTVKRSKSPGANKKSGHY